MRAALCEMKFARSRDIRSVRVQSRSGLGSGGLEAEVERRVRPWRHSSFDLRKTRHGARGRKVGGSSFISPASQARRAGKRPKRFNWPSRSLVLLATLTPQGVPGPWPTSISIFGCTRSLEPTQMLERPSSPRPFVSHRPSCRCRPQHRVMRKMFGLRWHLAREAKERQYTT